MEPPLGRGVVEEKGQGPGTAWGPRYGEGMGKGWSQRRLWRRKRNPFSGIWLDMGPFVGVDGVVLTLLSLGS